MTITKETTIETTGKIYLIGFGPGSREHMSQRAIDAIAEADVIIGYSTYIHLVKDLIVGKEVIRKGMTEEIDRCVEAYEQAMQGKIVAMVSSGDIGIYGMAGPTYEVLFQSGWTPDSDIAIEVIPGTTALSACAALVGAPLTHDFCSISLSDLLTPWPTIARRLDNAAKADFVIALYNPKSGRRTGQIVAAQKIILRYRDAKTPVAIVKSAYRRKQKIQLTTLDQMSDADIGMLSTVLIGNSTTFVKSQLMVTPRGYANKYQNLTGGTHAGERAGRSLSMGLNSWKDCVIAYAKEHPDVSYCALAEYFISSEAEIYSALQMATSISRNDHITLVADATGIESIIHHLNQQQSIEFSLSNQGANVQITIEKGSLSINNAEIMIKNNSFQSSIKRNLIVEIWLIEKPQGKQFVFSDKLGHTIFSIRSSS